MKLLLTLFVAFLVLSLVSSQAPRTEPGTAPSVNPSAKPSSTPSVGPPPSHDPAVPNPSFSPDPSTTPSMSSPSPVPTSPSGTTPSPSSTHSPATSPSHVPDNTPSHVPDNTPSHATTPSPPPAPSPATAPSPVTTPSPAKSSSPSNVPASKSPDPKSSVPSTHPSSSPSVTPSNLPDNPRNKTNTDLLDENTYNIIHMSMGGALVLTGLVFLIFGYRLIKPILFFTGFLLFSFLSFSLIFKFAKLEEWIVLCIAVGIGILGGVLMIIIYKVGIFFTGLAAGSLFAAMVISLTPLNPLLLRVLDDRYEMWIILGIVLAVGILFGLLALKLVRPITIISTALFGSGLFISGISLFPFIAKTGVSVDALKSAFSSGSLPPFSISNWVPYTLLAVYIILAIGGIVVQFRVTAKNLLHKRKRVHILFFFYYYKRSLTCSEEEGYPLLGPDDGGLQ